MKRLNHTAKHFSTWVFNEYTIFVFCAKPTCCDSSTCYNYFNSEKSKADCTAMRPYFLPIFREAWCRRSYTLFRSLLFSVLFIEIIYYFPQNHVRSLRGCRKWGKPLEKCKNSVMGHSAERG